ncbi:MAG: hypothetical protein JXA30_10340 [Deltaproteobacteria bacterium]|nr:hypothetical protein [Deltaproteobacteria bacterium]
MKNPNQKDIFGRREPIVAALCFSVAIVTAISSCGGPVLTPDSRRSAERERSSQARKPSRAEGQREERGTGVAQSRLCVFDYDLTLSSHACEETEGKPEYHCRLNRCGTYSWNSQCLGVGARQAVAECVRQKAFIGIASHADRDLCWEDKVVPMVAQDQFPELIHSPPYANRDMRVFYPAIDRKENWNCGACAYQMVPDISKPAAIGRIMRYYALRPESPEHRARVIFWDDSPDNIASVKAEMPEVKTVLVPRHGTRGDGGGCGITPAEIEEAWR